MRKWLAILVSVLWLSPAFAAMELNMPRGVTPISHEVYDLHMLIFWICVAIAVGVFSVVIYSLIYHRKSRGAVAAKFHEHVSVEIIWTIIPFLILVLMAIPATKTLFAMEDASKPYMTIKITGYQWKWRYTYLDQGLDFFSQSKTPYNQIHNTEKKSKHYLREVDKEMVVPVNKKVRLLVTSNDVNHAWWVPEFGFKRDAIPGFINEAWIKVEKPGVYRGQCAELCGIYHGFMPVVVRAVPEKEFKAWVAKQKGSTAAKAVSDSNMSMKQLMKIGEVAYGKYCVACHQANGEGMPPTFPGLKASSVSMGKPISRHIDMILHGIDGTAMQAFADQLTDAEIAAIVTYERNAWDNNTGDVVQPADVKKLRKK